MWKLTIEDDQANKTTVHLVRDDYGIGRGEDNSIRLTERNISRRHARIERSDELWLLKDLQSYNGCYINGQRVSTLQELSHGDLVQVGDYRLMVENEALLTNNDTSATVPAIPRNSNVGAAVDRLVVLAGPMPGTEFALAQGPMILGRGEDCDISLNHPSVSRVHAEVHPLGDGRYEIFDKDSANGVRVNGVELPRSFIDARDVIELGDVILKFIPAGDTYIPGSDESLQLAAIGAARRQEAEEGHPSRLSGATLWKIGAAALIALTILGAVIVLARSSSQAPELKGAKAEVVEPSSRVLSDAKQLLSRGEVRAAYKKLAELPPGAAARSSADFRMIQAAYADHLFGLAENASDTADKHALYDEIARTPSIDAARRIRATQALAALSKPLDISELPRTVPPRPAPSLREAATLPNPLDAPIAPPDAPVRPPAAPKSSAARSSVAGKPPSTTLVRENPFGANER